jgi:hypothetical protein
MPTQVVIIVILKPVRDMDICVFLTVISYCDPFLILSDLSPI